MRHGRLIQSYSPPPLERSQPEIGRQSVSRHCVTPMTIRATAGAREIQPQTVVLPRTAIIHAPNLSNDIRRLHRANIRRNLTRRIQMAKQQGNFRLLRLLETELQDLVLR